MLDIAALRIIWWLLLGFILIVFAMLDGFDFGAAALLPFVARNSDERRIIFNAIGPFWEGNQVWIILGAGAMFAAWPYLYAVAFSAFYYLILLLLLTMSISRPVTIKYRSKIKNARWQLFWDSVLFIGGVTSAGLFGLLIGNVFIGAPFYFDRELRIFYDGSFVQFFQPFTLLCAAISLSSLMMHGALYLAIKTDAPMRTRAISAARLAAMVFIICFALAGWMVARMPGLHIVTGGDPYGFSNPLYKTVIVQTGAWLQNYALYPYALLCPILGYFGAVLVILTAAIANSRIAFLASCISIMGTLATVGMSLFPFLLPSSTHPNASLLIWDASSNELTLLIMLVACIIFVPLIICYTAWVYHALRGKVRREIFDQDEKHATY